jgi:hypothetical protein
MVPPRRLGVEAETGEVGSDKICLRDQRKVWVIVKDDIPRLLFRFQVRIFNVTTSVSTLGKSPVNCRLK